MESSNNSVGSILADFSLPRSSLQELLNQPNDFIDANFSGSESEAIRASLIVAYRRGFRTVFVLCASLAALSTLVVVFLMPQVELDRPDDQKLKQEGKDAFGQGEKGEKVRESQDVSP